METAEADAQSATGMGSDYTRPVADHAYGNNFPASSSANRGGDGGSNSRTKPVMQTSGPAFGGAPLEDGVMGQ